MQMCRCACWRLAALAPGEGGGGVLRNVAGIVFTAGDAALGALLLREAEGSNGRDGRRTLTAVQRHERYVRKHCIPLRSVHGPMDDFEQMF